MISFTSKKITIRKEKIYIKGAKDEEEEESFNDIIL